jgi:hypothetical protein
MNYSTARSAAECVAPSPFETCRQQLSNVRFRGRKTFAQATDIGPSYIVSARRRQSVNSAQSAAPKRAQTRQSTIRRSKSSRVMVGFRQMILLQSRNARPGVEVLL